MKKDNQSISTDKRKMSKLEKENARLKAPAEHPGHALKHTDVEVADITVATSWPAESVRDKVQEIIGKEGCETSFASTLTGRGRC